jgi:hypothetical protein
MALPILDGNQTTVTLATTVSGGAHYPNHIIASSVTISSLPAISGTVTIGSALPSGANRIGVVTIGGGTVTIGAGTAQIGSVTASISNFPATQVISGTVTANVFGYSDNETSYHPIPVVPWDEGVGSGRAVVVKVQQEGASYIPIFGTVAIENSVTIGSLPVQLSTTTIGGTARLNVTLSSATTIGATAPSYGNLYGGSDGTNLRAISVDTSGRTVVTGSVSVASTTVTVSALPSGALTTRFGSVTTANTAQITTAVTNTSRKYLLAQNISTATVTIGIGFSPTTTQGIQLTAGAGLTFDSFVPTGAVYWLGATTGAAYTILEG